MGNDALQNAQEEIRSLRTVIEQMRYAVVWSDKTQEKKNRKNQARKGDARGAILL